MIGLFGAPRIEQTIAGDEVSTRTAKFETQEEQVLFLREMITEYRATAAIRARARDIIFRLYNSEPRDEVAYAIAIGDWVQRHVRYVRELPEVFQTPLHTIATGFGDCEDQASLCGSLLESAGIVSELVALSWPSPGGGAYAFQHIFIRAVVNGRRLPLDSTLERPIADLTDPLKIAKARGLDVRVFVA